MTDSIALLEAQNDCAATPAENLAVLQTLVPALRTVDLSRAYALSAEAVSLARASGSPADIASSLCLLGGCASFLARHEEAGDALNESLTLSRRTGDRRTEAHCLHFLGRGHYLLADYAAAIEDVTESLAIAEAAEDWVCVGDGFNLLGVVYLTLCDYGQGLHWFKRGLEARERTGDEVGVGSSFSNIGALYWEMGDYTQSVEFKRRGLDHARRLGDLKTETICLSNLSSDWAAQGRYADALEAGQAAVVLGERLGDKGLIGRTLTNIAHTYTVLGRYAEALEHCALGLDIARSFQDTEAVAETLCCMGVALSRQGELEPARARLAEAAAFAQSVGARKTAFQAAAGLSEVCKRQGDYAAALGHYETFRRLEKEVFSEEADKRAKGLAIQMEVEHHRHEAEALAEINAALQEANARLEALATTDPLTGLPNHRALVEALDAATAHACREGEPCALLFMDIDHFKKFNDTYGHPVGDAVLRDFAACVRACLRPDDTLGRWGGEEFLVLLPGTNLEEAIQAGERVRAAVAGQPLADGLQVTCSLGAAACPPQQASRDAMVSAADQALYAAKRLGRNQVRGSGDPPILALDGSALPRAGGRAASQGVFSASAARQARLPR